MEVEAPPHARTHPRADMRLGPASGLDVACVTHMAYEVRQAHRPIHVNPEPDRMMPSTTTR